MNYDFYTHSNYIFHCRKPRNYFGRLILFCYSRILLRKLEIKTIIIEVIIKKNNEMKKNKFFSKVTTSKSCFKHIPSLFQMLCIYLVRKVVWCEKMLGTYVMSVHGMSPIGIRNKLGGVVFMYKQI